MLSDRPTFDGLRPVLPGRDIQCVKRDGGHTLYLNARMALDIGAAHYVTTAKRIGRAIPRRNGLATPSQACTRTATSALAQPHLRNAQSFSRRHAAAPHLPRSGMRSNLHPTGRTRNSPAGHGGGSRRPRGAAPTINDTATATCRSRSITTRASAIRATVTCRSSPVDASATARLACLTAPDFLMVEVVGRDRVQPLERLRYVDVEMSQEIPSVRQQRRDGGRSWCHGVVSRFVTCVLGSTMKRTEVRHPHRACPRASRISALNDAGREYGKAI